MSVPALLNAQDPGIEDPPDGEPGGPPPTEPPPPPDLPPGEFPTVDVIEVDGELKLFALYTPDSGDVGLWQTSSDLVTWMDVGEPQVSSGMEVKLFDLVASENLFVRFLIQE